MMLALHITDKHISLLSSDQEGHLHCFDKETQLTDFACLQSILASWVDDYRLHHQEVVIAIPIDKFLYKVIEVSSHWMEWEIYRYVQHTFSNHFSGLDLDDYRIDFEVIGTSSQSLRKRVRIVTAQKEVIAGYIVLAESSGLSVKAVDVDVFSLETIFSNELERMKGNVGRQLLLCFEKKRLLRLLLLNGKIVHYEIEHIPLMSKQMDIGCTRKFIERYIENVNNIFLMGEIDDFPCLASFFTSQLNTDVVLLEVKLKNMLNYGLILRHAN